MRKFELQSCVSSIFRVNEFLGQVLLTPFFLYGFWSFFFQASSTWLFLCCLSNNIAMVDSLICVENRRYFVAIRHKLNDVYFGDCLWHSLGAISSLISNHLYCHGWSDVCRGSGQICDFTDCQRHVPRLVPLGEIFESLATEAALESTPLSTERRFRASLRRNTPSLQTGESTQSKMYFGRGSLADFPLWDRERFKRKLYHWCPTYCFHWGSAEYPWCLPSQCFYRVALICWDSWYRQNGRDADGFKTRQASLEKALW